MTFLRDVRAYLARRVRDEDFITTLDALGVDDDTRQSLLYLAASGAPADVIERAADEYMEGTP